MARIIVTAEPNERHEAGTVVLEERVYPVHLASDHAAAQLVERLAWAVGDAESGERADRRA
jgi:hypothetical protein